MAHPGGGTARPRRIVLTLVAAAAGGAGWLAVVAPGASASTPVVQPGQTVQLVGSDVDAVVSDTSRGLAVYGELVGPNEASIGQYDAVLQDSGVAVAGYLGGRWRYVYEHAQPRHRVAGNAGRSGRGTVSVRLGETVRVAGSDIVIAAGRNREGEASLVAVVTGAGGAPLPGSYGIGISARRVAVLWLGGRTPTVAFERREAWIANPAKPSKHPSGTRAPGALGRTITVYDTHHEPMAATLVRVADSAQPATSYDAPPPGYAFVTATLRLRNEASITVSGDADADVVIIGSDGKAYAPDQTRRVAGCQDFWDGFVTGGFSIGPGKSATGCLHFEVPQGVRIARVYFSRTGSTTGAAEWTVG
ncbi:MAG TPA: hypothetical protein VKV23_09270 [Acidimicrobiales bacterium]|jgi:hypothetical protein|nr:hypothetical protein [Acidimicrobiales bacterium]